MLKFFNSKSSLTIRIDDFTFTLLLNVKNIIPGYENIIKIQVSSSNINLIIWVYQSNSELGLWRLCSFIMTPDNHQISLNKGDVDYVQSSLIHLDLQKFINENIINIPSEDYNKDNHKCICLDKDFNHPQFTHNDCENKNMLIQKIDDIMSEKTNRPIFEEPFLSLDNEIKCGQPHEDVNKYLQCFSINLEEQFIMGTITKIHNHIFIFKDKIKSKGEIYSIELNRKITYSNSKTNNILLYVLITKLSIFGFNAILDEKLRKNMSIICGKQKHIFPFLLTPKKCKINYYGLYSNYIPCGVFICKLFDYNFQCSKSENLKQKCIDHYTYIGSRYNNLFPLKQTIEHMQSSCSISGGVSHRRRNTYKNNKKRNKKCKNTIKKRRKV